MNSPVDGVRAAEYVVRVWKRDHPQQVVALQDSVVRQADSQGQEQ
jgi:hypothetical protein